VVVVVVDVVDVVEVVVVEVVVVEPHVGSQHGVGSVGNAKHTQPFCCSRVYPSPEHVSWYGLHSALSTHSVLTTSSVQVATPITSVHV
jgi:hypothetical protein